MKIATLTPIIILLIFNIIKTEKGVVYFEIITDISKQYTVKLCIGIPNQCFNVHLSLNTIFTWIAHKDNPQSSIQKFDDSKSNTYKEIYKSINLYFEDQRLIYGKHFKDFIWFKHSLGLNLKLFAATQSSDFKNIEGILGLGYSHSSESLNYSFIEQLYNLENIANKIFTITISKDEQSEIIIGKLPKHIEEDKANYKTCSTNVVNSKFQSWVCCLKQLRIHYRNKLESMKAFDINSNIGFDYNIDFVVVPLDIIKQIQLSAFEDLIQVNACWFGIRGEYHLFTCDNEDSFNSITSIELGIDNWNIPIPLEKLFMFDKDRHEYVFIFAARVQDNDSNSDTNSLIIGKGVLKRFQMVFDEDNQQIGFYPSKTYLNAINKQGHKEEDTFIPPFHHDRQTDSDVNEKIIPQKDQISFLIKFIIGLGFIIISMALLVGIWAVFRYYRRRKNTKPSIDYNKLKEIFSSTF